MEDKEIRRIIKGRNTSHISRSMSSDTDISVDWLIDLFKNTKICPDCELAFPTDNIVNGRRIMTKINYSDGGRYQKGNVYIGCIMCHFDKNTRRNNW